MLIKNLIDNNYYKLRKAREREESGDGLGRIKYGRVIETVTIRGEGIKNQVKYRAFCLSLKSFRS